MSTLPVDIASRRRITATSLGIVIFLVLLVLLLYTFIHESGHALVGLLLGGQITAFSANFLNMDAHVVIDGTFNPAQNALMSAAGPSFPLLLSLGFLILAPKRGNTVFEWFKMLIFLVGFSPMLAWIVIPWLVQAGNPVSDDSAAFLGFTHIAPILESGAALLIYLAGWVLYLKREGGIRSLAARLRSWPEDLLGIQSRRTLLRLAALGAVALTAALSLTLAFPDLRFTTPADYQPISTIDLSTRTQAESSVYVFSFDEPSKASFFFGLKNVRGGPLKIWLAGPGGYENVFFAAEDPKFNASKASVNPRSLELAAGSYQLHITAPASKGLVSISVRFE